MRHLGRCRTLGLGTFWLMVLEQKILIIILVSEDQAQILTPIPSTGFMYNPHMGRLKNLTCFEVFCLISTGAFSSNTALRNCFGTLFSEIPLRQQLLFRNSANEGVNILAWLEPALHVNCIMFSEHF